MTSSAIHVWRIVRWGRTLGANGALRAIERSPQAPAGVRRLAWLARLGTFAPRTPRYAEAFRKLGPAAIKLGQALATRPDLVGEAAAHDFAALQDRLPPEPFSVIRAAIEAGLEKPIPTLFSSIDERAVGAASVAQVHRAVTTDGRDVAIKVLRPGIEARIARDTETFLWAASRIESMGGEAARLRPRAVIEAFRRWTERELDLRMEAASASELATNPGDPGLKIPAIDWARTGKRILTLEWMEGVKVSDAAAMAGAGVDGNAAATTLVRAFLHQAIARGFFHADLHQGNLFALGGGQLGVIDFGIMGRLDRRARTDLAKILYGLLTADYETVARVHFDSGYVPKHHHIEDFAVALRAVGEPIRGLPVKDISIANLLDALFAITRQFEMPTQPHLLLLQKTMVMVEGVAASLDPHVNTWAIAEPYVRGWMRDELGPEARVADAITTVVGAFAGIPGLARRIAKLVPDEVEQLAAEIPVAARIRIPWWGLVGAVAAGAAAASAMWAFAR